MDDTFEETVNTQQAAKIIAKNNGRSDIKKVQAHIRQLRRYGKLKATNEDEDTQSYLFRRADVEAVRLGAPRVPGVRSPRKPRKSEQA